MANKKINEQCEKIIPLSSMKMDRNVLPKNVVKIGEQVLHDKNIYISQDAYKEIHKFTQDKLSVESGGMLVGYTLNTNGKINIIIDGFIEGKYSEGTATTLKFTHETWEYVNKIAEKEYPQDKIIGWIHTHPNFGIFLSNYDKFIQENFFSEENQIAYVVDPIQNSEGFFFWINNQIEKCPGFYIFDEEGIEIDVQNIIVGNTNTDSNKTNDVLWYNHLKILYPALGAIALIGIGSFVVLSSRISSLNQQINSLNEQVLTQNQAISSQIKGINDNIYDVQSNIGMHTIVFLTDENTLYMKKTFATGEIITPPVDHPEISDDEMYTYSFEGWSGEFGYAVEDAVYIAKYTKNYKEYKVTFIDENGNLISEKIYHYGATVDVPEYEPDVESNNDNLYTVTWDKEIEKVSSDVIYQANIVEINESKVTTAVNLNELPQEDEDLNY